MSNSLHLTRAPCSCPAPLSLYKTSILAISCVWQFRECWSLSLHSVGRCVPSDHWSNTNLAVQTQLHHWRLITPRPPGYKDMHSCCSVAQKPLVIYGNPPPHSTNKIVLQEAQCKQRKPSNLICPFQCEHYTAAAHPLSEPLPSNESSDIIQIVEAGCKEFHNCTFPIGWPSSYWVLSIIFPITGDWPEPVQSIHTELWAL